MAGGWTIKQQLGQSTDSTEIYEAGHWIEVGPLPTYVAGLRGASVQNSVYMMGGDDDRGNRSLVTYMLMTLIMRS